MSRRMHVLNIGIIVILIVILACLLTFIGFYLFTTVRAESITTDIIVENCESFSEATDEQPYGLQTLVTTMNEVTKRNGNVEVALDYFVDNGIIQSYTIEPERIVVTMSDGSKWHYVMMDAIQ